MSEAATLDPATILPPVLPDWPGRVNATKANLIEQGMHADYAAHGAWWLVLAEVMLTSDADAYDAEIELRESGVLPPECSIYQRWTRTRGGDYFTPGSRPPAPLVKQEHTPPPPKGRTPAEFVQKHRPRDLDRVLWAWRDCHGFAEVKTSDVHEKVRFEIAGERASEWSEDDFSRAVDMLVGRQLHDGRLFQAIGPRGFGRVAAAYVLRFPEVSLRGPLKDQAFAPWLARITEHTLRLRDDPTFMPGEELYLRMAYADRQAMNSALTAYAAEIGEGPANARARFERAGLGN